MRAARKVLFGVPLTVVTAGLSALIFASSAGAAQAPVGLGAASSFAVLAGSGITNTGSTTVTGDVGTFPTTAEVGFNTMTLNGVDHAGDAVTQQAKTDLTSAFTTAAAATPSTARATELGGGQTLTPGVYNSPTFGITGTLNLDTQGDPSAVFIFQAASTLITASSSNVNVVGGGVACNVFWQVGSSATLGTNSHLVGTVMAQDSITATTGATVQGRLLARTAAVTLDTNVISVPVCPAAVTTTTTTSASATSTTTASGSTTGSSTAGGSRSGSGSETDLADTGMDIRWSSFAVALIAVGTWLCVLARTHRRRHAR